MNAPPPKDLFIRTKSFAIDTFKLCNGIPKNPTNWTISDQLRRSSSSVAANFRASKRAKSSKDYSYKINVVEEEADESLFWLELLSEFNQEKKIEIELLMKEANELTAIFTSIGRNLKNKL